MKIIHFLLLITLFTLSVYGADKEITLSKGWNQISVPFDRVNIDLLTANENIEVVWAYQNFKYNVATRNEEYIRIAKANNDIDFIRSLSYGESLYILAKEETILTIIGSKVLKRAVRSEQITSLWQQMSRDDFTSSQWNSISKIIDGAPLIAAKIVMKDSRPSIKVYTNDAFEADKINAEYFEDFSVGENEAFWVKDITSTSDIDSFEFKMLQTPSKGGNLATFSINATSTNEKRHFLHVQIVAIKDGDSTNNKHILYDDYVKLGEGEQEIQTVVPMLLSEDFGEYKIFAIKDIAAQYEKDGIDVYDFENLDEDVQENSYSNILDSSDFVSVGLNENAGIDDIAYTLKVQSREYANSVLYYDPLAELNKLAKARSKDLSELGYEDIERHTEIQMTLRAFGHGGEAIDSVNIKTYIETSSGNKEVLVLSNAKSLDTTTTLNNVAITLPDEDHGVDVVLPLMFYGEEALLDNTDLGVYNTVMEDLGTDENKICLDTECSQWIFKKTFDLKIAVSKNEPSEDDIIKTLEVKFYSDTFTRDEILNYESKDTTLSLANLLVSETIFRDENSSIAVGILGSGTTTDILINDLKTLQLDLVNEKEDALLFDPLKTFDTDLVEQLIYGKNEDGSIDKTTSNDVVLQEKWENFLSLVGEDNICNRINYYAKTVPYTKKVNNPRGGADIEVITATQDLCIYNTKYQHIMSLDGIEIESIAGVYKDFVLTKNTRNEEDRLVDFWNPLFSFNNATLRMPEAFYKKMPVIDQRIGGGAYFNSKLALDSELNELRVNVYADIDAALIFDFKLFDLDYETIISGSDPEGSRFDLTLYSVNPTDINELFELKKIFTFHQQVEFTYQAERKFDLTFSVAEDVHFVLGVVPVFFEFEIGVYSFFTVGVDLDMVDHFAVYAIPGARIFGTIAGGLGFTVKLVKVDVGVAFEDFTVVRTAIPVVAQLDNFVLDKNGFSSTMKIFGDIHIRAAEISASVFAKIATKTSNIVDVTVDVLEYEGFNPFGIKGLPVGTDANRLTSDCQQSYKGFELFCIRKELAIKFKFSGLDGAECKLLDDSYGRRSGVENDTSYLYSTNEYRKVRGCVNDKYEFAHVTLDDWVLTQAQQDEIDNIDFWKWDSRALISHRLGLDDLEEDPYATPWADAAFPDGEDTEEVDDEVHEAWKDLTGFNF